MTYEPMRPECAETRRRLAEGDADRSTLDHVAGCPGCSAFAASLRELEARIGALAPPTPPAAAAERAVARFRAELAGGRLGAPGTAVLVPVPTEDAATAPVGFPGPAGQPPVRPPRGWRRPLVVAAIAAVAAVIIAVVLVGRPGAPPPAGAATLREAAAHTAAEKTARFDLSGSIGLSVLGTKVQTAVSGTGKTEFPDRGSLTESTSVAGLSLREDVVSIGNVTWTQINGGGFQRHQNPAGHVSAIDQAIVKPNQALNQMSRIGTNFRDLGASTVDGVAVRRIQLTIPGDDFHAFGDFAQQVPRWTVVVAVDRSDLVLRQITVDGGGSVAVIGPTPFTYHLQITMHDFGAPVHIQPPGP